MNFLLDTNILVSADPTSADNIVQLTPLVAELLGLLNAGRHGIWIHPASVQELAGDKDQERREMRRLLLGKYPQLPHPPGQSARLVEVLGSPAKGSHNEIDLLLLSALDAEAVDCFVTQDDGIHRRARRTNLSDRVLRVAEAMAIIRALFPTIPVPPPHVVATVAHALHDDPIFDTLRADYDGFDAWLSKCKREQRRTWVIEQDGKYAGLCIVKEEQPPGLGRFDKSLKLCTFKIADAFRGLRYGELLLKTVFSFAVENGYHAAFVDVFPKHEHLVALFSDFGFMDVQRKPSGEMIMLKMFRPGTADAPLDPLAFNVAYGPFAVRMGSAQVFVVPIQPRFHQLLFPESELQLQIKTERHPFSNSIRKAYLCHSALRQVSPGDLLLFYCSTPTQAATALGVVDGSLASDRAPALARFVGRRTVYAYREIERMATKPVLALLFRLSRVLPSAWPLDLLVRAGIVRRAPQSIVKVQRPEALAWIADQLGAWR